MRIAGLLLIILGLLFSLSIVGAIVGIPLMLIGFVMVVAGRRKTIITNVVTVTNTTDRAGVPPQSGMPLQSLETKPAPQQLPHQS